MYLCLCVLKKYREPLLSPKSRKSRKSRGDPHIPPAHHTMPRRGLLRVLLVALISLSVQGANVSKLALGASHSCALVTDGEVRCWGSNGNGQLGDGTTTRSINTSVVVTTITNARSIAAGDSHSCAVLLDGAAKCWGSNYFGHLGDGSTSSSSTPVLVSGITTVKNIALSD